MDANDPLLHTRCITAQVHISINIFIIVQCRARYKGGFQYEHSAFFFLTRNSSPDIIYTQLRIPLPNFTVYVLCSQ